jgi:hypothetical protein
MNMPENGDLYVYLSFCLMSKNVVIFGENHWSMSKNPDVYGKPWGHVYER